MSDSGADKSRIRELVARCLERDEEPGDGALDAICAEAPELKDAVRRRLETLRRLGLADAGRGPRESFPERLGDFRLLRCIGGGGMGVVYLAQQESLGRTVALKLIRPEHLYFPNARERFRREVDAVARLRHPAVVPIYTFDESGAVPYYAMEWVDGASLEEVLALLRGRSPQELSGADLRAAVRACRDARAADRLPIEPEPASRAAGSPFDARSWVEACLRIALPVAHALEHAHRAGVIHRDLKPSNLMLTSDGRVLVLDFGLASTRGTSRLTQSGAQLGSLPFMPPEIVREGAGAGDARSDVYSLGVTLYELLTLQRAFGGEGESSETTRDAILAGRIRPPRAVHPAIPWDAETVCLVAMERDPQRRYADAGALAADLQAVLALRPIAARRPSALLRARRFVQRHPALAVAGAAALLLATTVPGVWAWQQQRRIAALHDANERLVRAVDRTRAAVTGFLDYTASVTLTNVPGAEPLRRELIERAVALLEEIHAEQPTPAVRNDLAQASSRFAVRCQELGDGPAARRADARALELFAAPGALPVATFEDRLSRALVHGNHANLLDAWDDPGALDELRAARSEWAALHAAEPRREILYNRCVSIAALAQSDELPVEEARREVQLLTALMPPIGGPGRDLGLELLLGTALGNLAIQFSHRDLWHDAQPLYEDALARLVALDRERPDHVPTLAAIAGTRFEYGQMFRVTDRPREALEQLAQARAVAERLARLFPARAEFHGRVAFVELVRGEALLDLGEAGAARDVLESGVAGYRRVLEIAPHEFAAQQHLGATLRTLAKAHLALGDAPAAGRDLAEAFDAAERGVEALQRNPWAIGALAEAWLLAALEPEIAPEGLTRVEAAARALDSAAEAVERAPDVPDFAELAREAGALAVGELLEDGSDVAREEARGVLRRLAQLGALDLEAVGANREFARFLADPRFVSLIASL